MLDKQWLDRVALGARVYIGKTDDDRSAEILKFVEWLYREYGIVYRRPDKADGQL